MSFFGGIKNLSDLLKQWENRRKDSITENRNLFLRAVENGEITQVSDWMNKGINVNCSYSENGVTPLHIAAENGNIPLLLQLLSSNSIKIDPINLYGYTPLHIACIFEKCEVVKILIERGANVNQVDKFDKTCLHLVAASNNVRLANFLIRSNAHINVIDFMGNTPLHIAIDHEYLPMIKLFLVHGANPNIKTKRMPLFLDCVLQCHSDMQIKIIQLLLTHEVDYEVLDPISQRNAMHFVALSGNVSLAYILLKLGCCSDRRDIYNTTAEEIAIRHNNFDLADLLHTFEKYGNVDFVSVFEIDILEDEKHEATK